MCGFQNAYRDKYHPEKKKGASTMRLESMFRVFGCLVIVLPQYSACNKNARLLSVRHGYRFLALPPFNLLNC
jgi:hypothetical protein